MSALLQCVYVGKGTEPSGNPAWVSECHCAHASRNAVRLNKAHKGSPQLKEVYISSPTPFLPHSGTGITMVLWGQRSNLDKVVWVWSRPGLREEAVGTEERWDFGVITRPIDKYQARIFLEGKPDIAFSWQMCVRTNTSFTLLFWTGCYLLLAWFWVKGYQDIGFIQWISFR